jgi:hypothetical protein
MKQSAVEWVNNNFEKQIINEDIYASKNGIIESHIMFAKYQQENSNENALYFEISALKSIIQDMDATIKSLFNDDEVLNLCGHFAVEIQRQNKRGQYPIEIKGWFKRNKEKFKNK